MKESIFDFCFYIRRKLHMNGNLNINKELEILILKYKIDAGVYHF